MKYHRASLWYRLVLTIVTLSSVGLAVTGPTKSVRIEDELRQLEETRRWAIKDGDFKILDKQRT